MDKKSSSSGHRYVIGIDLGTTNCALSYIDLWNDDPRPVAFAIDQKETADTSVQAETLPSFLYLPPKSEWKRGQANLPLHRSEEPIPYFVGRAAREQASTSPDRVIASAKSWLCHARVDREAGILPWNSDEIIGDARMSPVAASAAYLRHLRLAWDNRMGELGEAHAFDNQLIVVTVPASFDEVAQKLTLSAAREAGYPMQSLRLLEEPQAAFYAYLAKKAEHKIKEDDLILICDIGGGTTDFSLFRAHDEGGKIAIERESVGDHLLLGGDNIDLSIAYMFEQKMCGDGRLASREWAQLVAATRVLKEKALADDDPGELHVSVASSGSSLFGGTKSASLPASQIRDRILEGFFPIVEADDRPEQQSDALKEMGLPYASDGAMTRHLAAFVEGRRISHVLFTGGTMKPPKLVERVCEQLGAWQDVPPHVLQNDHMDLACSLGASVFGRDVLRETKRIRSGYARTLYAEVAQEDGGHSLVCLIPKGHDSHEPIDIDGLDLSLWTEQPVRFQLFASRKRTTDRPGDIVSLAADEFSPLTPVYTKLSTRPDSNKKVKARLIKAGLQVQLTETGILELACRSREADIEKSWQLDFQVRGDSHESSDNRTTVDDDPSVLREARQLLQSYYGKKPGEPRGNPKYLLRDLEAATNVDRQDWNIATLRRIWPDLHEGMTRRGRTPGHEMSWLYLAGFSLRPGYGVELDEWRVAELWRGYQLGLSFGDDRQVMEQWWIMWRRVAGGLMKEAQEVLFDKLFPVLRKGDKVSPEIYMLIGSLERVSMDRKIKLGNQLVSQITSGKKDNVDRKIWALARMGSRQPLYAGAENIVRPKFIGDWHRQLAHLDASAKHYRSLALFWSQCGRVVDDREFDLPPDLREEFLQKLSSTNQPERMVAPVRAFVSMDEEARVALFGESLPAGLVLS